MLELSLIHYLISFTSSFLFHILFLHQSSCSTDSLPLLQISALLNRITPNSDMIERTRLHCRISFFTNNFFHQCSGSTHNLTNAENIDSSKPDNATLRHARANSIIAFHSLLQFFTDTFFFFMYHSGGDAEAGSSKTL